MSKIATTLIAITPVQINKDLNEWAVDFVFKCKECKNTYSIRKVNEIDADKFGKSLENGLLPDEAMCKNCSMTIEVFN